MHGLPKTIISNKDTKFSSKFWKTLFSRLETQLSFITSYNPQTENQTEMNNWITKDMLQMYVMDYPTKWEDYLHMVEFAYNNGYQTSLKLIPFEMMYGRKCRTPTGWDNPVEKIILGLEMLKEMEKIVQKTKQNLKNS